MHINENTPPVLIVTEGALEAASPFLNTLQANGVNDGTMQLSGGIHSHWNWETWFAATMNRCEAFLRMSFSNDAPTELWQKHVVVDKASSMINSAVANDFDEDGAIDIISSYDRKVVLLRGSESWPQTIHTLDVTTNSRKKRGSVV